MRYRVNICTGYSEHCNYIVEADSAKEAEREAMKRFDRDFPVYSSHSFVHMSTPLNEYHFRTPIKED